MTTNTGVNITKAEMFAMFTLLPNYTQDELKQAYRNLVMKYHPDKTQDVASTKMFQTITTCFKFLNNELLLRTRQPEYNEMKAAFVQEKEKYQYVEPTPHAQQQARKAQPRQCNDVVAGNSTAKASSAFDLDMFNKLFSKHRMKDANDAGYGKWKEDEDNLDEVHDNTLVKCIEPQPIVSSFGNSQFYELGLDKVKDFGHQLNDVRTIQFADFRLAHTTKELVDLERIRQRKDYKSIEDLEKDRATLSTTMSDVELRNYTKQKKREMMLEEKRQDQLAAVDTKINDIFQRNHVLLRDRILRQ
jgi:curved DNA-binding protein CbpA